MTIVRKAAALFLILPLLAIPYAQAQRGKFIHSTSDSRIHGLRPDIQPPISMASIYVLDIGLTVNGQPTSLVDCTLVGDPSYPNVGGPDGNGNCYVTSDSSGNFTLTGTYYQNCVTDSDIVYLEGIGGFPAAVSSPSPNDYIALLSVPPSEYTCGYIYENSDSLTLNITDLTNVMAAFAVGTFANTSNSPLDGISTNLSGTAEQNALNTLAINTAFDAANNVVPITTGLYGGSDMTVEKQLYTIANVIASCIDSTSPGTDCPTLFGDTQGPFSSSYLPTNTWQAAESMGQNPTNDVSDQWGLISSTYWTPYYNLSSPSTWTITQSSTTPVISSLSASSGTAGSYIDIYGSNLTATGEDTIVAFCGVLGTVESATSSDLYVKVPSGSDCTIGVYVGGDFSNFVPFNYE